MIYFYLQYKTALGTNVDLPVCKISFKEFTKQESDTTLVCR